MVLPRMRRRAFFSAGRAACVTVIFVVAINLYGLVDNDLGGSDNLYKAGHRRILQVENAVATESPTNVNVTVKGNEIPEVDDSLFPQDLFLMSELRSGAIVLHVIGVIYMFYALALVCDEFFVPSLDVIAEKLEISPDVAGATFMAAGGSAPELFTSVIGVFIAKNDVGIGTIVGSAVFNILFVIAACAFAAKEALSLTAWPLIRDVFFYSVSLILLVIFFIDDNIMWWEALILFIWYGIYVSFMKFNEPVEDGLRKLLHLAPSDREGKEKGVTLRAASNRKGLFHLMNETINPGLLKKKAAAQNRESCDGEEMKPLNKKEIVIGDHAAGIAGLKCQLQVTNSSTGSKAEEGEEMLPVSASPVNGKDELNALPEVKVAPGVGQADPEGEEEEEGEDPIDMSFPKEGKKIFVYLVSFPIMAPLYFTLPDTKKAKSRKYFVITFLGSIVWIAVYSYLMVWWADTTGRTIGIPPAVMGLTFLAAGTSVPDLITSVLVAKQGKGDMAVSSSVGSNIFDVCVGLPVPWLLFTMINLVESVSVSSQGVGCSVSLLFLMLIFVFLAIVAFKWKMTKGMGIVMLVLYVIFVVITLGFSYEWYTCPI